MSKQTALPGDGRFDASTAIKVLALPALVVLLVSVFIPALDVHIESAQPYTFSVAFIEMVEYGSTSYLFVTLLTGGALALMWKKAAGWTNKVGWVSLVILTIQTSGWFVTLLFLQDQVAWFLVSEELYGQASSLAEVEEQRRMLTGQGRAKLADMLDVGMFSPTLMFVGLVLYWRAFWVLRKFVLAHLED